MNKEELLVQLEKIEEEKYDSIKNVIKEYVLSNNPYAVGDILQDHYQRIIVTKIKVHLSYMDMPDSQCVYTGALLTKRNTPVRSGKTANMYQRNVVEKIK